MVGLAYIVAEFCTQSHLATENFGNASEGIRLTRRCKKYTYWFRSLLGLWDSVLFLLWTVVRFPWQRATGRPPTAFNKTLVWDWKVKTPRGQAPYDRLRRRSSTHPLTEGLHDGRSSHDSRTSAWSEDEGSEDQRYGSGKDDARDGGPSGVRMPTLRLPEQTHSSYADRRTPSLSSETSQSPSRLSY